MMLSAMATTRTAARLIDNSHELPNDYLGSETKRLKIYLRDVAKHLGYTASRDVITDM